MIVHRRDDVGHACRVDADRLAGIGHTQNGQHRVAASDRGVDRRRVGHVSTDDSHAVTGRNLLRMARHRHDIMPSRQRLTGQLAAGRASRAEDHDAHQFIPAPTSDHIRQLPA